MGESRTYRMLSVIALVLGVIGVTLGYAAFSNTLTINSAAEVHPDPNNFNVDFSTSSSSVVANPVVATLNPTGVTGFTATDGTINNAAAPVINNIKATFTEPGQKATYSFYAYNAGQYIAYLKSITFNGTKTCTALSTTTQALVDNACTGITLKVTVGSETATQATVSNITGHSLAINGNDPITVEIEYAANSAIADGDFEVSFPAIELLYQSVD